MRLNSECKLREIAGETIIFLRGKSMTDMTKLVSLNETSVFLWNAMQDKEFVLNDLVKALTEEYDVTEETASSDAGKWISDMKSAGLVLE